MPETVLVLQNSNAVFTAQIDAPDEKPRLTSLLIGSIVEVNGVCLAKTDNQGKVVSFHPRDRTALPLHSAQVGPPRLVSGAGL